MSQVRMWAVEDAWNCSNEEFFVASNHLHIQHLSDLHLSSPFRVVVMHTIGCLCRFLSCLEVSELEPSRDSIGPFC
jgi:hypothetical protein